MPLAIAKGSESFPTLQPAIADTDAETRRNCKQALFQLSGVSRATVAIVDNVLLAQVVGGDRALVGSVVRRHAPRGCTSSLIHNTVT